MDELPLDVLIIIINFLSITDIINLVILYNRNIFEACRYLKNINLGLKFREYENQQWIMCFFFAGYHVLVLANLLSYTWLIISFLVLVAVAYLWTILYNKLHGGIIPFLSHFVADIGIIGATYMFAFK